MYGIMEIFMKEIGEMVKGMERVNLNLIMEKLQKVSGKMINYIMNVIFSDTLFKLTFIIYNDRLFI